MLLNYKLIFNQEIIRDTAFVFVIANVVHSLVDKYSKVDLLSANYRNINSNDIIIRGD